MRKVGEGKLVLGRKNRRGRKADFFLLNNKEVEERRAGEGRRGVDGSEVTMNENGEIVRKSKRR